MDTKAPPECSGRTHSKNVVPGIQKLVYDVGERVSVIEYSVFMNDILMIQFRFFLIRPSRKWNRRSESFLFLKKFGQKLLPLWTLPLSKPRNIKNALF